MRFLRNPALCALLTPLAVSAVAQEFTGVIQHQIIEIFNETVVQIGGSVPHLRLMETERGGISGEPTPEQEAYGFDPGKVMKMTPEQALSAANEFDGSFYQTVNTIYVSRSAICADFQTPMDMSDKISYIVRRNRNLSLLVLHAQKKYVELDSKFAGQTVQPGSSSITEDGAQTPFRKTGERTTINGVECERYSARDAESVRELWLSTAYADLRAVFDLLHDQMIKGVTQEAAADDGKFWQSIPAGFPILVKELTPGGSLSIEEIKSIKRQPVDPKLFEIPLGYKKISLTEMMKMQIDPGDKSN